MAIDILIRQLPSILHTTVGRSFYTPQGAQSLYGGAEVWQGYYQSVRPTPKKMMINVDLSATAFYESGSLVDMVVKILNKRNVDDLRRIQDRDRAKLEKSLKNLKVYVTHRGENASKRRLRITKLTNTPASSTKFEADGKQLDVASYFNNTYGRRLQYPFLPCIVARKKIYLPMEVCNVVEVRKITYRISHLYNK